MTKKGEQIGFFFFFWNLEFGFVEKQKLILLETNGKGNGREFELSRNSVGFKNSIDYVVSVSKVVAPSPMFRLRFPESTRFS